MATLKLHTLMYTKADLEAAPADERTFFLMATSVANDTQALNKTLVVILGTDDSAHRIVNQANSAYAFLVLRLIAGRLNEAWKLVRRHKDMLTNRYTQYLTDQAREGLEALFAYFDHPKPGSLIWRVRDGTAFHHDEKHVAAAFDSLDPDIDLGDYLSERISNTLFYTTEMLQYETLRNLAGTSDTVEAIQKLIQATSSQTTNFNDFIYGYTLVFAERYLLHALKRLPGESDTFEVSNFDELSLPYFSILPKKAT